jgi:hypothetical protein
MNWYWRAKWYADLTDRGVLNERQQLWDGRRDIARRMFTSRIAFVEYFMKSPQKIVLSPGIGGAGLGAVVAPPLRRQ